MGERFVVFSHGKDSEPWGTKIMAMADTARFEGYGVESVDYRGIDTVKGRIEKLIDACKNLPGDLVLVGSSLGGYISLSAATMLHARGVFLLAPALYLEGLPPLKPKLVDCPVAVVHGWHDDVVPLEHSLRFAREYNARLHILNDDHRLLKQILFIKYLLENFLVTCDLPSG